MFLSPVQHGLVQAITSRGYVEAEVVTHELLELIQKGVISPSGYVGKYVAGINFKEEK